MSNFTNRHPKSFIMIISLVILIIGACAIIYFMFEARGGMQVKSDPLSEPVTNKGHAVTSPSTINHFLENPFEFTTIDESLLSNHQRSYLKISGLKDLEIESKINHQIKLRFESYLASVNGDTLPNYRGISKKMEFAPPLTNSHIGIEPLFNSNGILSLRLSVFGIYGGGTQEFYWSCLEGLTFDLNTGELISLFDVFTDDADVVKLSSDGVMTILQAPPISWVYQESAEEGTLSLVAPFKGITPEQKFYLENGAVTLIIDGEMPEFQTNFQAYVVNLPYSEIESYLAIGERFMPTAKNSPFIKEALSKHFYTRFLDAYETESLLTVKPINNWTISWRYPTHTPQTVKDALVAYFQNNYQQMSNDISFTANSTENKGKDTKTTFAELSHTINPIGPFYNLQYNGVHGLYNTSVWLQRCRVVDALGQIVPLSHHFSPGYDYKPIIMKQLKDRLVLRQPKNTPNAQDFWDTLDYAVGAQGFDFYTQSYPWQSIGIGSTSYEPIYFTIPYSDFDEKALLIFD